MQLRPPRRLRGRRLRDLTPGNRVLGHGISNSLRVDQIRVFGEIVNVVAGLVVVHVVGDARLAAEEHGFLGGLDDLGAGEEASGWDAVLEEGGVVGAAGEDGRDGWEAFLGEEVLEVFLDDV